MNRIKRSLSAFWKMMKPQKIIEFSRPLKAVIFNIISTFFKITLVVAFLAGNELYAKNEELGELLAASSEYIQILDSIRQTKGFVADDDNFERCFNLSNKQNRLITTISSDPEPFRITSAEKSLIYSIEERANMLLNAVAVVKSLDFSKRNEVADLFFEFWVEANKSFYKKIGLFELTTSMRNEVSENEVHQLAESIQKVEKLIENIWPELSQLSKDEIADANEMVFVKIMISGDAIQRQAKDLKKQIAEPSDNLQYRVQVSSLYTTFEEIIVNVPRLASLLERDLAESSTNGGGLKKSRYELYSHYTNEILRQMRKCQSMGGAQHKDIGYTY